MPARVFDDCAVPQDAVARRMGHRPAAAEVVEQAALALAELGRRDLVGEVHVAGAAGLREAREEGLRALELVEREVAAAPGGHRHDDLGDPVGMRRAAGNVDDRQAGLGLVVLAEEAAVARA